MKKIPISPIANQRLTYADGGNIWQVEIKQANEHFVCSLWLNDEPVISGQMIAINVPFIQFNYLSTSGNFAIVGGGEISADNLGISQELVFWT